MQQPQLDLDHFANLPTIKPPPKQVVVGEYKWSLMPATSRNMGPLDGMTSVPINGRHDKCANRWKALCLLFYQLKPRLLIHHIPMIYDQHYEILI
jgi:hypothetical protein